MDTAPRYIKRYALQILIISLFCIGIFAIYISRGGAGSRSDILKVAFLDVGQGDSIYLEAPNGRQMLIDGGPGPAVLSKLAEVMPFGDRSIDILLATHTDADHITGLNSVLDSYTVSMIFENGAQGTTRTYANLESKIATHKIQKMIARRGTHIVLDQDHNVYVDILFPDRVISKLESNDGSIVAKLVYGGESFMLTGDATMYTEHLIMVNEHPDTLHASILKLGHHGSKGSSSELWLEKVHPEEAIVSAGLHNRYGHPAPLIIDRLAKLKIPYLATLGKGTILFKTNGLSLKEKQLIE
jgi:competence protein ComEC